MGLWSREHLCAHPYPTEMVLGLQHITHRISCNKKGIPGVLKCRSLALEKASLEEQKGCWHYRNVAAVFVVWSIAEFGSSSHSWAPQRIIFSKLEKYLGNKLKLNLNWECFVICQLKKVYCWWYRCFSFYVDESWLLRFVKWQSNEFPVKTLELFHCCTLFLRGMCIYLVKSGVFSSMEERKHQC